MPSVTLPISDELAERLNAAAARADCSKAAWIREALAWALDEDENPRNAEPTQHIPAAVQAALPRMRGRRIILPTERTMERM